MQESNIQIEHTMSTTNPVHGLGDTPGVKRKRGNEGDNSSMPMFETASKTEGNSVDEVPMATNEAMNSMANAASSDSVREYMFCLSAQA